MSWSHLTLVTDAELGQIESEATAAAAPWGATTWANARAEAKRELKIWIECDYPQGPSVTDRILDRWAPDYVYGYTGGAYTDYTDEARDDTEEDIVASTVLATAANDRIYIGAAYEFEGAFVKLLDSLNAVASVLTAKYWGTAGWTSLSATDGTIAATGKTLSGTGRITWTLPTAWERRQLNAEGDEYYWCELSVSVALTAGTAITQILPIRAPDGLKRVCAYLALANIFRSLAASAANPQSWLERASNDRKTGYYDMARELYAALREKGGIPIDTGDQVIEPSERQIVAPGGRLYRG